MQKECCNINEVIQEYYKYLNHYILGKVKDPNIADDIVQEVMVKLVKSHTKNIEVDNIKAWLFQISRNTIYDYFNTNNTKISLDDIKELSEEQITSQLEVSDYMISMIKMLPQKYAIPLMLSDIEKIAQKDIAKKLNLSLSATKMRVQRARVKLKELFVECCDIEYDKNGNFIYCTIKPHCEPLHNVTKKLKDC